VEEEQYGVGDAADAELQAGAVLDQTRDVPADGLFDRADVRRLQLDDRLLALDDDVDLGHVDERVAMGARHVRVDLRDHRLCDLGGRLGVVDRDAERTEAMLVGWGDVDQGHVGGQVALAEQLGDLAEEHGDVVAAPVLYRLPRAGADEERLVEERARHLRLRVLPLAHGDHMVDLDVLQLGSAGDERVDEVERLATGVGEHDAVPRLDDLQRLGRCRDLAGVVGLPVHPITP